MKIDARQIPPEGLFLEEQIDPKAWELETDFAKFKASLKLKAEISKVTNLVTALIQVEGEVFLECVRCLGEYPLEIKREIRIDYPVDNVHLLIDFDPEIRDQLILGYPVKPLCRQDCKGLCPGCGEDLNSGACNCKKNSD